MLLIGLPLCYETDGILIEQTKGRGTSRLGACATHLVQVTLAPCILKDFSSIFFPQYFNTFVLGLSCVQERRMASGSSKIEARWAR